MSQVLIIGGGIGGLTAAVALRRRGLEATVYEAAPELRPVGKGIWVPTNAMVVLQRLGLGDAVQRAGWALERIQLRSVTAGVLEDFDLQPVIARHGQPTVSIHRAALVQVLVEALPAGALHLDKRCTGLEQDATTVTVHFADGTRARGDVLVGADGIHSLVREQLIGGVPLRYSGQTCYRGIADWEPPKGLERTCMEIWGGTLRIGFSAVGPWQLYWFATRTAPANSAAPGGPLAERLADDYAGFPAPVPDMLRHTPSADVLRTDLYDFAPLRRWSQGRVVLLGDAAHAMTPNLGQGGGQAIEDAYVLAEQLAHGPDPAQAFRAYEKLRLPRVRWIVKTARRLGRMAHVESRLGQKLRNLLMRGTPRWYRQRQLDRIYSLNF